MQTYDVAVLGATGTLGETLVQLLEERQFPIGTLHVLASLDSAGSSVPFKGKNLRVRDVANFDFKQVRLVFLAGDDALTQSFYAQAQQAGCSVIDLSGSLSLSQAPRILPEVNAARLSEQTAPFLIACPSPGATALALVLAPLLPICAVQRIVVTACMAMSTQGPAAIGELARQTTELLNVRPLETEFFDRQVAFNVLAQVGQADAQGHTRLEIRLVEEARQLLGLPEMKISATCIQVPVFFGDSLTVSLHADAPIDLAKVHTALDSAAGVERVANDDYPTAVGDAVGQDTVYVGRVRHAIDDLTGLDLWITADNVRKGAALNAVQMAELLIKHYL